MGTTGVGGDDERHGRADDVECFDGLADRSDDDDAVGVRVAQVVEPGAHLVDACVAHRDEDDAVVELSSGGVDAEQGSRRAVEL